MAYFLFDETVDFFNVIKSTIVQNVVVSALFSI